jgi:tRNA(fMet)-specific endonuclease VapC
VEILENEVILDTDVIIDYLKKTPDPDAKQLFQAIKRRRLAAHMTSITFFELCRGARLSPEPERSLKQVKSLQAYINVLPFDRENAEKASEIYVYLEKRGEPLEIRDVFIGASARTHRIPLTTQNITHFERIPDVQVITPRALIGQL